MKLLSKHFSKLIWIILVFLTPFQITGQEQFSPTLEISVLSKVEVFRNPPVVFVKKDFDLQKNYKSIANSFKSFERVIIPSNKVTLKIITRFQIVNKSDELTSCYFFPGFFFSKTNLYQVVNNNQLVALPSIAPNHKDSVSFRLITLQPNDSMIVVAECTQIKTYVNLIRPRFIEEHHIEAYIFELQSHKKGDGLFTYVFCGLLIMMVFFRLQTIYMGEEENFYIMRFMHFPHVLCFSPSNIISTVPT